MAYNVVTQKSLSNSIGTVLRNYTDDQPFNPQRQVRGITYKAIDKIGQSVSKYEIQIKNAKDEVVQSHPLLVLAKSPNPKMNASQFNHLWAMIDEIYGESFWYLAKGETSRKVKEIYLLNPAQVEIKTYEGELIGYVLHKSSGTQVGLEIDEVVHNKRPNPFNEWRGMSVLELASTYVDTELVTSQFTLSYMQNNASPSGIVTLPDMDKETFKQFCQQWREGYEGPQNAGKTAFIRGDGANFKAVGATLKDVDQKVTRDMAKEDVLMMFEVPKPLLGLADQTGLGRANVDSLNYIFNSQKIDPMMERLDGIWEQVAKFGLGAELSKVDHESPIPEDKVFELDKQVKAVNKWITVNEARAMDDLEPIDGGDELNTQNQVAAPVDVQVKTIKLKKVEKKLTAGEIAKKLNDDQEKFRLELVETNEIYARQLKAKLSRFADGQEAKILSAMSLSGKGLTKAYEEWLPSIKEDSVELAAVLTPIILALMVEQAKGVANFITGELLVITPDITKTVEAHILKISGAFNEDTIKALEKTLTEGATNGESMVKLKHRVESTFQDTKGYRAERIARTESLRASNRTAELSYKQNGYSSKKWFSNPGACDFCKMMEGNTKSIGSNFLNLGDVVTDNKDNQMRIEYDNIDCPPIHPNCKCSIVPED